MLGNQQLSHAGVAFAIHLDRGVLLASLVHECLHQQPAQLSRGEPQLEQDTQQSAVAHRDLTLGDFGVNRLIQHLDAAIPHTRRQNRAQRVFNGRLVLIGHRADGIFWDDAFINGVVINPHQDTPIAAPGNCADMFAGFSAADSRLDKAHDKRRRHIGPVNRRCTTLLSFAIQKTLPGAPDIPVRISILF